MPAELELIQARSQAGKPALASLQACERVFFSHGDRVRLPAVPDCVQRAHGPVGVERLLADLDRWGEQIQTRHSLLLDHLLGSIAAAA